MRTGECSTTTGVYRADCGCGLDVEIRRNDDAPVCPVCRKSVRWTFLRATLRPPPGASEPIPAPHRPPAPPPKKPPPTAV